MPFLTGDVPAGSSHCYPLFVPDDLYFRLAVRGAIWELTKPEAWEQFGTLTPDESAALALEMYESFAQSECEGGGDMELIATAVLAADAAYIEFTSIPATYETLVAIATLRSDDSGSYDSLRMQFNGDDGNNYDYAGTRLIHSSGTLQATTSLLTASISMPRSMAAAASLAGMFNVQRFEIPHYADSSKPRMVYGIGSSGATMANTAQMASVSNFGLWRNTAAAINSIKLFPSGGTVLVAGSRVYLYGLKGA